MFGFTGSAPNYKHFLTLTVQSVNLETQTLFDIFSECLMSRLKLFSKIHINYMQAGRPKKLTTLGNFILKYTLAFHN